MINGVKIAAKARMTLKARAKLRQWLCWRVQTKYNKMELMNALEILKLKDLKRGKFISELKVLWLC